MIVHSSYVNPHCPVVEGFVISNAHHYTVSALWGSLSTHGAVKLLYYVMFCVVDKSWDELKI